ncbi:RidA family protein [Myroides sp. LJL115]
MKKIINSEKAPAPIGPYNHAVLASNFLFISGQIPFNQQTQTLIDSSIEDQAKQVMANLEAILKEANMGFENVVKSTIFLTNMDDFAMVNQVYGSHFEQENAPARECVQVAKLPRGVDVEISMIATK